MVKMKVEKEKKVRRNGKLNHGHDNPYIVQHSQIDPFRCKMKDTLNLYLYMSQPETSHGSIRRPKYLPFLRRNLYYMQEDVVYSRSKSNNPNKYKSSTCSLLGGDQGDNAEKDEDFPHSLMSPSLSFYKVRFDDGSTDYDYADIQCFRAREVDDGQFTVTEPVDAAHFHMKLNEELKIDIDLPNFTPDLPENAQKRFDYLLLKLEIRTDGIAVSGGRKLRSVPARQAAQSELKQTSDPHATEQPQIKIMFGVRKISTAKQEQPGHSVREGRAQIALIPAEQLGIDVENSQWLEDLDLVNRIIKRVHRPARHPFIKVEVFLDDEDANYSTAGSALSSARVTPIPPQNNERQANGDNSHLRRLRHRSLESVRFSPMTGSETPTSQRSGTPQTNVEILDNQSSASSLINCPTTNVKSSTDRGGILGIVPKQYQNEMLKARVPDKLAWCFRMSNDAFGSDLIEEDQPDQKVGILDNNTFPSSTINPPPADVFRFTGNYCAICSPDYRRTFPTFVSLLYHLSTTHPRLSFKFKKNLVPIVEDSDIKEESRRRNFSPNGSIKSENSNRRRSSPTKKKVENEESDVKLELKQCPGLIVNLNNTFNGSHEFDTSRHYMRRLSVLREGSSIRHIPEAWSRSPIFLVVKNLAKYLRTHPPSHSLDELETRNNFNDGTFGGCAQWQDPHFHTRPYALSHAPFIHLTQQRRIHDYFDVNKMEKRMLSILSEFHSSFRTLVMPHQTYGSNIILVEEKRDLLLTPPIYTQFVIQLASAKDLGNLHEAEFYDIIARLRNGPDYDPRSDPKHYVHLALLQLEKQRPINVDNQKKNGNKKVARNSREWSTTSSTTTEESISKYPVMTRKRSIDESAGSSSSGIGTMNKRRCTQTIVLPVLNDNEGEKKRIFKTETPMEDLLQNRTLSPSEVPLTCFDDLACRYQFASEKTLKSIWHFCRKYSREFLEWQ